MPYRIANLAVLALFSVGAETLLHAQTEVVTETAWGLHSATFDTLRGQVTVHLPAELSAGDTLTGTVVVEPSDKRNDKGQRRRSRSNARGKLSVLYLAGTALPATGGSFLWTTPADLAGDVAVLRLLDSEGIVSATAEIPVGHSGQFSQEALTLPSLAQAGRPVVVDGPFDGDVGTTKVTIDGRTVPVLAESPRRIVVRVPADLSGPATMEVSENGTAENGGVRIVAITLSATKRNLRSGERTRLTVTVNGLDGLTERIPLTLVNRSPGRVTIEGGNTQEIVIEPAAVTDNGSLSWSTRLIGVAAGGFEISAWVTTPADPGAPPPAPALTDGQNEPDGPVPDPDSRPPDEPSRPREEPAQAPEEERPPSSTPEAESPNADPTGVDPEPPLQPAPIPAPEPTPFDSVAGPPDGLCCCPKSLALIPNFENRVLPLRGELNVSDYVTHDGKIVWDEDNRVGPAHNDSSDPDHPTWKNLTFKFQVVSEVEYIEGRSRRSGPDCSFTQEIQRTDDPNAAPGDPKDDFRSKGWEPDAPAGSEYRDRKGTRKGARQSFSVGDNLFYSWADPFQLHYDPDTGGYKKGLFTWYIEAGCRPSECETGEIEEKGTIVLSIEPGGADKTQVFRRGH